MQLNINVNITWNCTAVRLKCDIIHPSLLLPLHLPEQQIRDMIYLFYLELCNNKKTPAQGSVNPAMTLMEQHDPSHISPSLSAGIQPKSHLPERLPSPWLSREQPHSPLQTWCFLQGWEVLRSGIFLPQTQFPPLEGAADSHLSLLQQQGPGWALQLNIAKGSWMIQISHPASRFQRSGVKDCKPSADTAEQSASACA